MKFAVIVFPGSNCDVDMFHAVKDELGENVEYVWHDTDSLEDSLALCYKTKHTLYHRSQQLYSWVFIQNT